MVKAMNDAVELHRSADRSTTPRPRPRASSSGPRCPPILRNDLSNALINPVAGSTLVGKSVGIETDRNGVITFDRDKFLEAYAADPAAVEALLHRQRRRRRRRRHRRAARR